MFTRDRYVALLKTFRRSRLLEASRQDCIDRHDNKHIKIKKITTFLNDLDTS